MKWTDDDYVALKDGVCVAIAAVLTGSGAKDHEREFYSDNAGLEIKIMPRAEAVALLLAGMRKEAKA